MPHRVDGCETTQAKVVRKTAEVRQAAMARLDVFRGFQMINTEIACLSKRRTCTGKRQRAGQHAHTIVQRVAGIVAFASAMHTRIAGEAMRD